MTAFDTVVIGAGPAGSAAAITLAQAGLSVATIEREAFPRRKVCGDFLSSPAWELLRELGVREALWPHAGPPVRSVGFFGGESVVRAPMPGAQAGRAMGRHRLDAVLLERALTLGVRAWQPAVVESVEATGNSHAVRLRGPGRAAQVLHARTIVDAHGSWLPGPFERPAAATASDLLGFKASFSNAPLAAGLMPMVIFPGGYGGLVETEPGLVGFSCCIRQDVLRAIRRDPGTVGDALFAHIKRHCRGFREALEGSKLEGRWRGGGPVHPGVRRLARDGRLIVGNAAGEAHPIVAEGISMALQSGWLAARHLALGGDPRRAGEAYAREWRAHLIPRVRTAQLAASVAAHAAPVMGAALRAAPSLLTLGAFFSGKTHRVTALQAS